MNLRLVNAEFLKLRRRRGLLAFALLLTVGAVLVQYVALVILHANNPARYGPAGGVDNLYTTLSVLVTFAPVAGVLIGAAAGAGDLEAGLFRELVVTGRSRLALFAARVPGGLALLVPIVAVAWALGVTASFAFAGGLATPGLAAVLGGGGWLLLAATLGYLVALGLASLWGSRAMTVGVMLAWLFPVSHILLAIDQLRGWRRVILDPALYRISPSSLVPAKAHPPVSISLEAALLVIALWGLVPLAAGAWRTRTRDA
jgi:ABC-type transport system involved in multi-copper enzyme maturation permease subunit